MPVVWSRHRDPVDVLGLESFADVRVPLDFIGLADLFLEIAHAATENFLVGIYEVSQLDVLQCSKAADVTAAASIESANGQVQALVGPEDRTIDGDGGNAECGGRASHPFEERTTIQSTHVGALLLYLISIFSPIAYREALAGSS
jgi:hypothetical protein